MKLWIPACEAWRRSTLVLVVLFSLSAVTLFHVRALRAATFALQTVERMTERATCVVRARPIYGTAVCDFTEGRKLIITRTDFEILEVLSAPTDLASTITVITPGGTIEEEDLTHSVSGAPSFVEGEEVILFLWHPETEATDSPYLVLDLAAGKLEITVRESRTVVTRRDLNGHTLLGPDPCVPDDLNQLCAEIRGAASVNDALANEGN